MNIGQSVPLALRAFHYLLTHPINNCYRFIIQLEPTMGRCFTHNTRASKYVANTNLHWSNTSLSQTTSFYCNKKTGTINES